MIVESLLRPQPEGQPTMGDPQTQDKLLNGIKAIDERVKELREKGILFPNDAVRRVELHWYEVHGIGKRDIKIKHYLDES